MTEEEYEALKAQIRAGGYAQFKGRSATSVAELDFIRDAQERTGWDRGPSAGADVIEVFGDEARAGADAGTGSQAFTPEHVANTPLVGFSAPGVGTVDSTGTDGSQQAPPEPQAEQPVPPKADAGDIPPATIDALRAAGFDSAEKVAAASDEELLKVPNVGQATVAKLRAAQQG